jgi:ABC-type sugar transport system substrate-binding protein
MSVQLQERKSTRKAAPFVVLGAILVAVVVAVIAANGGGGETSGGSGGPTDGGEGVAAARALAEKSSARPESIGSLAPIGKPVPTGKEIAFISCGVEACEVQGDIIKQGAADLGWTAKTIGTDGSPEQLQNAFGTALRQGADAVILNAVTRSVVARQLEQAQQQGVPFVTLSSVEKTGDGILANIADTRNSGRIGEILAAQIVSDSEGAANTLYVNISAFQILHALGDQFESAYKKFCAECEYGSIDIPVTSLGKDAPDRIVSYLRSHPEVNYIVLSVSNALGAGLPAALQAAGLADRVKIIGQSGDTQTFQDLQAGNIEAVVPYDYYTVDYLMLDALARHFAGVPLQDGQPPLWTVKADNMPAEATKGLFPVIESYRDEFKQAWGKG